MASHSNPFLLLFLCFVFSLDLNAHRVFSFPEAAVFPVTRDASTRQYVTGVSVGGGAGVTNLVVDLGGDFLWIACDSGQLRFPERAVTSCSIECSKGRAHRLDAVTGGNPMCYPNTTCGVSPSNHITGRTARGKLRETMLTVDFVDPSKSNVGEIATTVDHRVLFACGPTSLLQGLAGGTRGMLGLSKAPISLPSQLHQLTDQKFSLCLSPSNGVVLFGNSDTLFGTELIRSLSRTPLFTNDHGQLFILIKSIRVNGNSLSITTKLLLSSETKGNSKVSTTSPYTTMETSIYEHFMRAYMVAADSMNLTRVAPVGPFRLCYGSNGQGLVGPKIEFVLQSEMVKWGFHGGNSLVQVDGGIMCLGFLDGGFEQETPIVIGGLQLENSLVEFDMGASLLGFSSSLLSKEGRGCSGFLPTYLGLEKQVS